MFRGETIALRVDPHVTTVNDLWGSRAIILHLAGLKDVQLAPPKPSNWGDTIFTSNKRDRQALTFNLSYTFPSSLAGPDRQIVDGTITGDVFYPEPFGAFEFQDKTVHINIPVHAHLIPSDEVPWKDIKIILYIIACLGMLVFVFTPAILLKYDKRNFWPTEHKKRYGMSRWLFLVVLYGGGLLIALVTFAGYGSASCYGEIYTLAGILIVLALVAVIATTITKKIQLQKTVDTLARRSSIYLLSRVESE
ncbi:hypothetical protein [Ktedonospora formicarum]|uniref:hypothetical protein n=1 Tax=Ktedonospora formicarum TaxID=2778364 RepID=UPI001C687F87|nr:hypothetical protein [Ktedonospora formicarum]